MHRSSRSNRVAAACHVPGRARRSSGAVELAKRSTELSVRPGAAYRSADGVLIER